MKDEKRLELIELGAGFYRLRSNVGFMETGDVPRILQLAKPLGLQTEPMTTSFFLGRESILDTGKGRMARWRKKLYIFLARNAEPATAWFNLPPGRVVEMGMQLEL